MLGAAACEKCGWSPLGAASVGPAADLGGEGPFVGGGDTTSLATSTVPPAPGLAPPPPPPPSAYAGPAGGFAPQTAKPVPPQGGCSGGGCVGLIVLVAVAALGVGIFAAARGNDVVDDVRDAVDFPDGSDDRFDGDRVDAPAVAVGAVSEVQTIDSGDVAVHPLGDTTGTVTIQAFGFDGFDPFIRVESGDGEVLGEDDDGGELANDSLLRLDLSEPGAVLLVEEFGGDPGGYRLLILEGDGAEAPTTGPALTVGSPTGGVVVGRDHSVSHPFVGAGAAVSITVAGISGLDPVVTVFGAAGEQLARNDDFGAETGRDARVDLTVAAGVQVTVEVSGFGSSAGPYLVTVEPVG
jgi:hypothetical protein